MPEIHNPFFLYRARVDRVIDGDTIDVIIDCGFRFQHHARVRLMGVDTAEVYGVKHESDEYAQGKEHSKFVKNWVLAAEGSTDFPEWPFALSTVRDETGKYGRYLADVYRRDDGSSLVDTLKEEYPEVAV